MILAPSILTADFLCLGDEIRAAENGGAGMIHCDVMDGHFVPNITFGPLLIKALRRATTLPLDVHLMIENADAYLGDFRRAHADRVTVHAEACTHLHRTLARIRELGARPGVALNPASPLSLIEEVLGEIDLLLIMTVNPGFGGQSLIEGAVHKLQRAAELRAQGGHQFALQVDGGISAENVAAVVRAGADIVVAGSAVFDGIDPRRAAERIVAAAARA